MVGGGVEVDAVLEDLIDRPVQRRGPLRAGDIGDGAGGIADRLQHVEAMPRRPPLGHRIDDVLDHDPLRRGRP